MLISVFCSYNNPNYQLHFWHQVFKGLVLTEDEISKKFEFVPSIVILTVQKRHKSKLMFDFSQSSKCYFQLKLCLTVYIKTSISRLLNVVDHDDKGLLMFCSVGILTRKHKLLITLTHLDIYSHSFSTLPVPIFPPTASF